MSYLLNDLRTQIEQNLGFLLIGAGISIGATKNHPVASWTGLLKNGVKRCVDVVPALPPGWEERVIAEIGSGDIDDLLSAAQKVSNKLRFQSEGEYAAWLQETVGSLRVEELDVI